MYHFNCPSQELHAEFTQELHAELGVDSSILGQRPQHKTIGPVSLQQLDVSPHHLHLPLRVEEVASSGSDHDVQRDLNILLDHLQQT